MLWVRKSNLSYIKVLLGHDRLLLHGYRTSSNLVDGEACC